MQGGKDPCFGGWQICVQSGTAACWWPRGAFLSHNLYSLAGAGGSLYWAKILPQTKIREDKKDQEMAPLGK